MRRAFLADAVAAAPPATGATSEGYPTDGDVLRGIDATAIGAFWFYVMQEAVCTVIEQAGLVLSDDPNQFRDALLKIVETMSSDLEIASVPETLAGALDTKATSPAGVKAALAALVDSAPGTLDTLNELAAALGDDANFAATVNAALAARAQLAGATFTGTVRGPTPAAGDDSTRLATTAWIQAFFGAASHRSYTVAGNHSFNWDWGTNAGLAFLLAEPVGAAARNAGRDISLAGVSGALGAFTDTAGEVLWVVATASTRAYNASDGTRNAGRDIAVGGGSGILSGGVSDGTTAWIVNETNDRALAYRLSDGVAQARNIDLGAGSWQGGFSDGTTLWFIRNTAPFQARAWTASTQARNAALDIDLASTGNFAGGFSEGTIGWAIQSSTDTAYAYDLETRLPRPGLDVDFSAASNAVLGGVAAGGIIWGLDSGGGPSLIAYDSPRVPRTELTVGGSTYRPAARGQGLAQMLAGVGSGDTIEATVGASGGDAGAVYVVPLF